MSDEAPKKPRRRSPYTESHNSILVEFTDRGLPHDSPEFQERARQAAQRPIPDYLRLPPSPESASQDIARVEFTLQALPPDHPDAPKGERKGRPVRSPSLPPEEPKPDDAPPAA